MRRELQRQEWEREEEEAMKRPVGPIHYEDIRAQGNSHSALSKWRKWKTFANFTLWRQRLGISAWDTLRSLRMKSSAGSRGRLWTCSGIRWDVFLQTSGSGRENSAWKLVSVFLKDETFDCKNVFRINRTRKTILRRENIIYDSYFKVLVSSFWWNEADFQSNRWLLYRQTTDQRTKRERLKEKRQAVLQARLAKVRQRKMKKAKLDGTEEEEKEEEGLFHSLL